MFPPFIRIVLSAGALILAGWLAIGASAAPEKDMPVGRIVDIHSVPFTTPLPAQIFLPLTYGPAPAQVLIAAAHIDSAMSGEADEAILLWNVGGVAQPLAGWQLSAGTRRAMFPITATLVLAPGERLWCAGRALSFRTSFGELPACEWSENSDAETLDMVGKLTLNNAGGVIALKDNGGQVHDLLVYGNESQPQSGWNGAPAQAYARGDLSSVGQVWERKRDPRTGLPMDSDHANDWSGDLSDPVWGRRVRFPGWEGWSADDLAWPVVGAANAVITVTVGPEGLYQPLADLLARANVSIDLSVYTLEHLELAQQLVEAEERGVQVRLLLEGGPPGGIDNLQKLCVSRIVAAGGEVRYSAMQENAPAGVRTRYRYSHAKYGVIDGTWAFNGTENFGYDSMPITMTMPVGGRRGFYLISDAPPVVDALQRIFAADWAPERFVDLHPYEATHARYGAPPEGYTPPSLPIYPVSESPFRMPVTFSGEARFIVASAPENVLRPDAGLLQVISLAGPGDEIVLMQLYEHKNWGAPESNPIADPNPRLEALIGAARRGARVRLLLDSYFDDGEALRSNRATVDYLRELAAQEGLDLQARLGNPTLGGIHAKLALARVGGKTWSAVGSLNGGEISYKVNREIVLMTDAAGVYGRLLEVFEHDWALASP